MTFASTSTAFLAANSLARNSMSYIASSSASIAASVRISSLSSSSPPPSTSSTSTSSSASASSTSHFHSKSSSALSASSQSSPPLTPLLPPKRLLLLRHGQALHNPRAEAAREAGCSFDEFLNLMEEDDAYDADLTPLGENQAHSAGMNGNIGRNKLALTNVEMVVSSPLSRALRTADLVHPPETVVNSNASSSSSSSSPRRVCIEHFREINGKLSNAQRRPRSELETLFPHWNFSLIPSSDESWTEELEPRHECSERGYQGLLWVMQQKEDNILLVCHGGLLNYLMNDHPRVVLVDGRDENCSDDDNEKSRSPGKRFGNCELREFIISLWDSNECSGEQERSSLDGTQRLSDEFVMKGVNNDPQPVITLEEVSMSEKRENHVSGVDNNDAMGNAAMM